MTRSLISNLCVAKVAPTKLMRSRQGFWTPLNHSMTTSTIARLPK